MAKRNYKQFPLTVVNNYMGDYFEDQEILDRVLQLGDGPQPTIVPGGQTPELIDAVMDGADRAPAFLTYDYELDQHRGNMYGVDCERVGYNIYAPTASKVLEVMYGMRDLFGHYDVSANNVNNFMREVGTEGFHFLNFEYEVIGGPIAIKSDGGRYAGGITIHFDYVYSIDSTGRRDSSIFSK